MVFLAGIVWRLLDGSHLGGSMLVLASCFMTVLGQMI